MSFLFDYSVQIIDFKPRFPSFFMSVIWRLTAWQMVTFS